MGWGEIAVVLYSIASILNATPETPVSEAVPLEINADQTHFYPGQSLFIFTGNVSLIYRAVVPLEINADRMEVYLGENLLILTGNVSLIYRDVALSADRIVLDLANGQASARGNVIFWRRGQQIFGREAIYNFRKSEAVILDAEYDGLTIFAEAERIDARLTEEAEEYLLHEGRITTCDLPIPHYHLAPETIRIIPGEKVTVYDSMGYIDKIPVVYLPYFRRSLRDKPYGYVFVPGYSSKKGFMFLNKFTYHRNEWVRPRLYLDGFTDLGVGVGASNRFGGGDASEFYGRVYGYYIDSKSGNDYLDPDENIGKDIDEERWRVAGHFYREIYRDLALSSRFQELSDEDFNRDFDDVGRYHHFSSQDLESDRNSFVNVAQRWDAYNLRVLYKERLHDFYLTQLADDERKPQIVLDAMENRILDSPVFWDALLQYDRSLAVEREQSLGDRPALGIDEQDDFRTRSETDRLHAEAIFSTPFSLGEVLRVIPRAGVHANSYQDTQRSAEYLDHFGNDDSYLIQEFDSVDQVALQTGVELNTRGIFDLGGPIGGFEEMRLVMEPNVSFDVFNAREDLTEEMPEEAFTGGPLADDLERLLSIPEGYPTFDARDIPIRDAQVLGFRLDSKLQGRHGTQGKRNIMAHSVTVAYDFDSEEYQDLQSDFLVHLTRELRLTNFVSYDLNDDFTREFSAGLDVGPLKGFTWRTHYSAHREREGSDRQESLVGGVDFPLGDKYTLGFSSRMDLDEGDIVRAGMRISRDLHDAVATFLVRYRDGKYEEKDEIDVRLHVEFAFSRPAELLGDSF